MITTKKAYGKMMIDLDGPEGNAFNLIGIARNLSKRLRLDSQKIESEMIQGDYVHLVKTFDRYFGQHVILQTSLDLEHY